jgi:hypothetical protein
MLILRQAQDERRFGRAGEVLATSFVLGEWVRARWRGACSLAGPELVKLKGRNRARLELVEGTRQRSS